MKDQVDILLATYQGGSYLKEQLLSILQQSYPHFHILIRDDGSTDQTLSIIDSFRQIYPEHISLIPSIQRMGVKGNFSELMHHAKARYIMLSDQDDIWLPHKIELSLLKMKEMENQHGTQIPLLMHTDLQVVTSDLNIIDPSFWHYSNLNPSIMGLNRLLIQNIVSGCALMMNQQLLHLAYPIPHQCLMHDWWIALVAAIFGKIDYIQESTLLYRQHDKNDVGAKKFSLLRFIKKQIFRKQKGDTLNKCCEQAQQLLERYSLLLNPSQKEMLHIFVSLKDLSYPRQVIRCLANDFIPHI